MDITTVLINKDKIRDLTAQEISAGENVMRQCLGVKKGEKVLIVTDPAKKQIEAAILFESAKKFTDQVKLISFSGMTQNAQEPPTEVAQALLQADVALLVTTYSLTHTAARKQANLKGQRSATLPGVTKDIMLRTLTCDYTQIDRLSRQVAKVMSGTTSIRITSANGTDITVGLDPNRPIIADGGIFIKPGEFGNLPSGETFTAPLEDQTNGVFVVDGSFANVTLDQPITIIFEKGIATQITGGQAADELNRQLDAVDPKARTIGELGIGTNPKANPSGLLIEAEKALGTCHLALGRNLGFGGTIDVPFHSDGVVIKPTVTTNTGVTIINNGQILKHRYQN